MMVMVATVVMMVTRVRADAFDVVMMALLRRADGGLVPDDPFAVSAQQAVHVDVPGGNALDPLENCIEDQRLIVGQGRYTDDIDLPGQAYGYVLRSPVAHARITRIDTSAAKAAPGVLLVVTGADFDAGIPCLIPLQNRDGSGRADPWSGGPLRRASSSAPR